jgi:DNA-binding YbaB/EbfC family protein
MFDLGGMMGKVKEMQTRMKEAHEKLGLLSVNAESGAGMVKVTVNGNRQLVKVEVDESLMNTADREVVQDLVVAATNKALSEIDLKIKEELQKATQGFMPNIPGFNFEDLIRG